MAEEVKATVERELKEFGTWNIGCLFSDFDKNLQIIDDTIKRHNLDLLCVQEMINDDELFRHIINVGNFPYKLYFECCASHVAQGKTMGVAVFAKAPLKLISSYKLANPQVRIEYNGKEEKWHDKYFIAVNCEFKVPITLITGHSHSFNRYGLKSHDFPFVFGGIDEWISKEDNGERELMIAADFNSSEPERCMPYVAANYKDVFFGDATRPSGRKTDCMFLRTNKYEVLKSNENVGLDHNFISIKFE